MSLLWKLLVLKTKSKPWMRKLSKEWLGLWKWTEKVDAKKYLKYYVNGIESVIKWF